MAYLQDETVTQIARELDRTKGKLAQIAEKTREKTREALSVAEVGVGALGFSWLNAKYGNDATGSIYEVAGVPVDLAAGVLLCGLAVADMAGGYEQDALMLGTGALASYACRLGTSLGKSSASASTAAATAKGQFGSGGYATGALPSGAPPQGATRFVVTEVPAYGG